MTERTCSVDGCVRKYCAKGMCQMHYRRDKLGVPFDKPEKTLNGVLIDWLRSAVAIDTDECQLWPYGRNNDGRGMVTWEGDHRLAHHVALILVGREAPTPPLETRHLCGNGHLSCINPKHLLNGTRSENVADMATHGTALRGERQWMSKLTEADVRAIREAPGVHRLIADRYGVSQVTVTSIKTRSAWAWLPD